MKLGNAIFTMGELSVRQRGENVEITFYRCTTVLTPLEFYWLLQTLIFISQIKDANE